MKVSNFEEVGQMRRRRGISMKMMRKDDALRSRVSMWENMWDEERHTCIEHRTGLGC
jgi:hypothetical protein